jgi:hypothetical protein
MERDAAIANWKIEIEMGSYGKLQMVDAKCEGADRFDFQKRRNCRDSGRL